MPFKVDWSLNIGTVASVIGSAWIIFWGAAKFFWRAHRENQERLTGIETRLTTIERQAEPVHLWFAENVIKRWHNGFGNGD